MIRITTELQEIKLLVAALEVEADNLEELSHKLRDIRIKVGHLETLTGCVEAKKKGETLAQLILDNGFSAKDLRLLDGRAFTKNQDGKIEEIDYGNNVIALDCRNTDDEVPF